MFDGDTASGPILSIEPNRFGGQPHTEHSSDPKTPGGHMSTYAVEIQPSTGFEFKNETFTVRVAAESFDSAARRGVRRAVARAEEWNAGHPDAITPRLADPDAYRVVAVHAPAADLVATAPTPVPAGAPKGATLIVALDLDTVLATLNQQATR
nr:hypothetical protein [Prescottella equi]